MLDPAGGAANGVAGLRAKPREFGTSEKGHFLVDPCILSPWGATVPRARSEANSSTCSTSPDPNRYRW